MKRITFSLISLILCSNIIGQVFWLSDINAAKSVAKKTNKLIVMDFWASWCAPCGIMDYKLWENSEVINISKKFVALKINVDNEGQLASSYNVRVIPNLIIVTASGDPIWSETGFMDADNYISILKALPDNVGELNRASLAYSENKKDLKANYSVGTEFQRVGKGIKNNELKTAFMNCSEKYLAKAKKLNKDPLLAEEIELYQVLNDVYRGRIQKALKEAENIAQNPQNEKIVEFRHFILAKCYKSAKRPDDYMKEKDLIKNKEFLDQLEY